MNKHIPLRDEPWWVQWQVYILIACFILSVCFYAAGVWAGHPRAHASATQWQPMDRTMEDVGDHVFEI